MVLKGDCCDENKSAMDLNISSATLCGLGRFPDLSELSHYRTGLWVCFNKTMYVEHPGHSSCSTSGYSFPKHAVFQGGGWPKGSRGEGASSQGPPYTLH